LGPEQDPGRSALKWGLSGGVIDSIKGGQSVARKAGKKRRARPAGKTARRKATRGSRAKVGRKKPVARKRTTARKPAPAKEPAKPEMPGQSPTQPWTPSSGESWFPTQ